MSNKSIIAKLIKTLFCVALLMSLVIYPPSSAHAHDTAHDTVSTDYERSGYQDGHGGHAHHKMGVMIEMQTDISVGNDASDTPNCCKGICMSAVISEFQSVYPHLLRSGHEDAGLTSFLAFDPIDHLRPPKHLI